MNDGKRKVVETLFQAIKAQDDLIGKYGQAEMRLRDEVEPLIIDVILPHR